MKEKVFKILESVLGIDATGIYCNDSLVEGDYDDESFYSTIEDGTFGFEIKNYIDDSIEITVEHGCSRLVLIPEEENFVIKLPITATYEMIYICTFRNIDDDNSSSIIELSAEDFTYEEEIDFEDYWDFGTLVNIQEDLRLIKSISPDCDLMDEENAMIENANEALAKILVPNEYIGKYNGIPVYIQKKIEQTFAQSRPYFREEKLTKEQFSTAKSVMQEADYFSLDTILISDLIGLYGEEETQLILEGIKDLDLRDLHGSNIGYFRDGNIGIIDYAGYNEDCIWCGV